MVRSKERKRAKIINRYYQAPHLAQDTNRKVTTSQIDIKTRAKRSALSQQVTTRHQQTGVHESITKQDRNNINDPQMKHCLGTVSKYFTGGLKPVERCTNLTHSSDDHFKNIEVCGQDECLNILIYKNDTF